MHVGKLIVFSALSFALPLLLALVLMPSFFGELRFDSSPGRNRNGLSLYRPSAVSKSSARAAPDSVAEHPVDILTSAGGSSGSTPDPIQGFVALAGSNQLDPGQLLRNSGGASPDALFMLSLELSVTDVERLDGRTRLMLKYADTEKPYAGWGIALKRSELALRPEVYWQGPDGAGGWFSFGELELQAKDTIRLTLLASKDSLSLLSEQSSDEAGKPVQSKFLGGFPLTGKAFPESDEAISLFSKIVDDKSALHLNSFEVGILPARDFRESLAANASSELSVKGLREKSEVKYSYPSGQRAAPSSKASRSLPS